MDWLPGRQKARIESALCSGSTSKVLSTFSPSTAHYEYNGILLILDFDVHTLADQFSCFHMSLSPSPNSQASQAYVGKSVNQYTMRRR